MPVKVRPRRAGETGKPFKIVNAETGKVEAESDTRPKAEAAARARNAAVRKTALVIPLTRAADITGENAAQVTGSDSTRRESLGGRRKKKKGKGRGGRGKPRGPGAALLRATLAAGLDQLCKQTKREMGMDFRAKDFAYVPDRTKPSTWKLRLVEKPGSPPSRRQVGMAVAALGPGGFRGQQVQIPRADLPAVKRKVAAAWRKLNPGKPLPRALG